MIVVAWLAGSAMTTWQRVDGIWRAELFDGVEPMERFPKRELNDSARRLEELGTSLGIDFSVSHRARPQAPEPEDAERFRTLTGPLQEWAGEAYGATDASLPVLPSEVESYLSWAESRLAAVEALLVGSPSPEWELDVSQRFEMPQPNFLGQMNVHRLLSLRALRFFEEGDGESAERSLEAAWRLRQATGRDPLLIAHLVAMSQAKGEQLVLRRLCSPAAHWLPRLEESRYVDEILFALELDGWAVSDGMRRGQGPGAGKWMVVPLQRLGSADYAEAVRHAVERLRGQDPRTFDNAAFFREEYDRIPRFNLWARLLFPNLFDSWLRAVQSQLETELTREVVRLRSEVPPTRGRVASAAVAGEVWTVEREGPVTRVAFEGAIAEPPGVPMALEYSFSSADCEPSRRR